MIEVDEILKSPSKTVDEILEKDPVIIAPNAQLLVKKPLEEDQNPAKSIDASTAVGSAMASMIVVNRKPVLQKWKLPLYYKSDEFITMMDFGLQALYSIRADQIGNELHYLKQKHSFKVAFPQLQEQKQDSADDFEKITDADFAIINGGHSSRGLFIHTVEVTSFNADEEPLRVRFEPWNALITVKEVDGDIKMKSRLNEKFQERTSHGYNVMKKSLFSYDDHGKTVVFMTGGLEDSFSNTKSECEFVNLTYEIQKSIAPVAFTPMRTSRMGHGITIFGDYLYVLGGLTKNGNEKSLLHSIERILVSDALESKGLWEEVDFNFSPQSDLPNEKFIALNPVIISLHKRIMILGGRTVTQLEDGDFNVLRESLDKTGFAFDPRRREMSLEIRTRLSMQREESSRDKIIECPIPLRARMQPFEIQEKDFTENDLTKE